MLRIAICDDDEKIVQTVSSLLKDISFGYTSEFYIDEFTAADAFIDSINNHATYDIVYLDIEIGGASGIEVGRVIQKNLPEALILVISGHSKYYKPAYEMQPYNFMDKPINKEEFKHIFEQMYTRLFDNDNLFNYQQSKIQKRVAYRDIFYFQSNKRQIMIHTLYGQDDFYGQLSSLAVDLKRKGFLLLHQSYLVNYNHIVEFRYTQVKMVTGAIIDIPAGRRNDIRKECMEMKRRYITNVNR